MAHERRTHFFINKPLQLRYMAYITLVLVFITGISLISLYIGIWGNVLDSFSKDKVLQDLLTASRMAEYEQARPPFQSDSFSSLSLFKQSEKLSRRQREIFKEILDESNRKLLYKLLVLFLFIALGSIFISHKIAGPFYRFQVAFNQIKSGNLKSRIHLRKFDEGQFLARIFNDAMAGLDRKIGQLKQTLRSPNKTSDQKVTQLTDELEKIQTSAN